jgi:hypothetical protein
MTATSSTITVLDPRSPDLTADRGKGPAAGALAGKRVGLRLDEFWGSWDAITEIWAKLLEADGATCVTFRAPVVKHGAPAAQASTDLREFLDSIDVAVVGLCNCGSCTLWAVHDALAALDHGLPTGLVATGQFERLTRSLSEHGGRDEIRLTVLPYPLEGQDEAYVEQVARDSYRTLLASLEATR